MRILYALIALTCLPALAQQVSVDTFAALDRQVAGLLDAWTGLRGDPAPVLSAQTALLRAQAEYEYAVGCDAGALPEEVSESWKDYLKASADCIFTCGFCFDSIEAEGAEELLSASFARWETCGEEFLGSVQNMR